MTQHDTHHRSRRLEARVRKKSLAERVSAERKWYTIILCTSTRDARAAFYDPYETE